MIHLIKASQMKVKDLVREIGGNSCFLVSKYGKPYKVVRVGDQLIISVSKSSKHKKCEDIVGFINKLNGNKYELSVFIEVNGKIMPLESTQTIINLEV